MNNLIRFSNDPWNFINGKAFRVFDDSIYSDFINKKVNSGFPECDIQETEHDFIAKFDIPGVKKEDLNIELKDNLLTVSGERKDIVKREASLEGAQRKFYGKFERAFLLPETVDVEKIEANYENGVLSVALPKLKAKEPKKIQIQIG